jgi:DNA-directed RNA polymerase subunit F
MIKELIPLTLAEVTDLVGEGEKPEKIKSFIKKFNKMKPDKAKAMKEDLKKLDLLKLKDEDIVKIVDFMPQEAADLSKIVQGISLDQDEVNKILEVTKKY